MPKTVGLEHYLNCKVEVHGFSTQMPWNQLIYFQGLKPEIVLSATQKKKKIYHTQVILMQVCLDFLRMSWGYNLFTPDRKYSQ